MRYHQWIVNTIAAVTLFMKVVSGQQPTMPDPFSRLSAPSPTTASLVKFTDIPVSGFSGMPDIAIPLYEISTSFVKVPVSLNYHAVGITVGQEASNIGLGWALNAGGVISRTVYGSADNSTWQLYRMDRENAFDVRDPVDYQQAFSLSQNTIDGVPDLYMYNLPGYSGKFIIADQVRQLPMTNLRITKVSNEVFHIVTPDGNKYIFSATESSYNKSDGAGSTNVVGWYLAKILSADRADSVVFTYADTRYISSGGESFIREFYQGGTGEWNGDGAEAHSFFTNTLSSKQLTNITFSQGSVEFTISWNTRQDIAVGDAGMVPLINTMVVKNKAGVVLRTISFRYAYFTNDDTGTDNRRLKLTGVYINGGNSTDTLKAQRYNLLYNGIMLPSKSAKGEDHWGYYNGANGNTTLIPSYTNCVDRPSPPDCYGCSGQPGVLRFTGANRESNGAYAAAGMLERITYPTGGYTRFEWEPHDVINYDPPVVTYQTRAIGSTGSYPTGTTFKRDSSADYYIDPAANPNGICATFTGRLNIPANAIDDATRIDHAAGSVTIYRRAGRVAVATFVFPYNENNQYNQTSNLTLEAGQHYFVMTEVRDNGFSVTGNLSGKVGTTTATTPNKIVGGCRLKRMTFWEPVAAKSIVKSYTYRIPGDTTHSSGRLYRMPMYNRQVVKFVQTGTGCAYAMYTGIRLSSNSMISLGTGTHIGYTYVTEKMGEGAENGYTLYNYQNSISFQGEFNPAWRNGYLRSKTIYNKLSQPVSKERNVHSADNRGFTSFTCSTVDYYVKHPCAPTDNFESDKPVFAGGKNWFYPSEWFHLDSTVTEVYDMDVPSRILTSSKAFAYDNVLHLQTSKIITKTSDGTELSTTMRYPLDYTLPAGTLTSEAQAIKNMQVANMHLLIESYEQRKQASQVLQTREASYMAYKSLTTASGPVVVFDKQYSAETDLLSGAFVPSAVAGNGITRSAAYALKATAHKYDSSYNIIEAEKQGNDLNAYIWDYNRHYMVAQFMNARQADVAYAGFEADGKGNWTYAGAAVPDATTITGKNCYNLAMGTITKAGLTAAKNYTVSYWTKNAVPYSITGTVAGYPQKGETANGWTCYEHKISGQSTVTISGAGFIDELRLYPAEGTAITYTYDPLVGVTSICNEGNKTSYYGYDSDGRLVTIKDQQGKILKQMEYQYQGAVTR
ncbi:RHS repeat domain-containing protein [Chitinophaga ginsengisoli]|uniref:YD repeat-containing protein n=1 Tax=Chitinophaga ginsengisoli TaxID=363837 RepID=A0A2P8FTA1_9BACT|nr:hypothetical protein [Chitinophaga ginsengisoli]PSL24865.1 YD repeat-containing protein [Chitinophaga ginsengisoli]